MKNLIAIILTFCSVSVFAQIRKSEAKKWRMDLTDLKQELEQRHVDLYHTVHKNTLDSAFAALNLQIPELNTNQILVRIAQLFALVGDGHTSFFPGNQKKKWFHFFPLKFWSFHDGIYCISTTEDYRNFLGKKLTHIEETPIEEVFEKVSTTIGADNPMEFIYSVPFEIVRPELLYVLGITKSASEAIFVFEHEQVNLTAIDLKEWQHLDYECANGLYPDGKSPSQHVELLFATALTLDSLKLRRYYWYTYLEESNSFYFQYNRCWDQSKRPSFHEMTQNLFKELDESKADRLIIDLRQNSGGEPKIMESLINELKKRKEFVDQGRVFVLVGRRTFSAAVTNAAQLAKLGARSVGEPPRGKPNHPSEGRDIDLPRTKIWATVSTQFITRYPELDDQLYLPIELECKMTIEDYLGVRDVALECALSSDLFIKASD